MTTRADVCVLACAEAFRGDGEIVASAFGWIPLVGARLAKATFAPDLVVTDGEAYVVEGLLPAGVPAEKIVGGYLPFRSVFDVVAAGRRHVMMGATQIDRLGNQNISCIGEWRKPTRQLIGVRGGPGNTVNHPTSYWVPSHSPRVFVERVDMISGVGYDHVPAGAFHEIRRVVTNLCVLDFQTSGRSMRLRSTHPGVTVDEVVKATGFALDTSDVAVSPEPAAAELDLIEEIDPAGLRFTEVPA